ncbi:MAG: hypothetical protein ABIH46_12620 [Chloroflexota bacterium]
MPDNVSMETRIILDAIERKGSLFKSEKKVPPPPPTMFRRVKPSVAVKDIGIMTSQELLALRPEDRRAYFHKVGPEAVLAQLQRGQNGT